MMSGFLRINEVAALAEITTGTAYQYNSKRQYGFPEHDARIGPVKFWKSSTAVAWARKHKKRNRR
jgi:predicted DNA-binding transcriptional regulator AlpA